MTRTPDKRPAKQFEPPPWERSQFEELQKSRRAEEDDAHIEQEISRITEDSETNARTELSAQSAAVVTAASSDAVPITPAPPVSEPTDVDPAVLEMLVKLSAEEPPPSEAIWKVGLLSSLTVASLGVMMLVWGIIGLVSAASESPAGRMGGVILMTFGAGFIGLAAWMTNRSLKQRGERSRG
ncbi:MAG: hypothetical protein Q8M66_02010 [Actinomycetota bacterium]|nr:hypothetical protein [Actinomycetota bacterium]MDZ4177940.1 hypothetical protein [Coriobacteriia bacterium]